MTGPRLPHSRPTPSLTGGDDRPRTPCADRPDVYETLHGRYGVNAEALEAARNMCGTCLLRNPDTAKACLDGAVGQWWRRHVLSKKSTVPKQTKGAWARHHDKRLAALRQAVSEKLTVTQAAERLGVARDTLWMWCDRHGHRDLYGELRQDGRGNQHRAGTSISLRRKRVAA